MVEESIDYPAIQMLQCSRTRIHRHHFHFVRLLLEVIKAIIQTLIAVLSFFLFIQNSCVCIWFLVWSNWRCRDAFMQSYHYSGIELVAGNCLVSAMLKEF